MKKLILLGTLSLMFIGQLYAGGLWSVIKNDGLPNKKSKAFTVDVKGVDIRGYVFDVPEMKSICLSLWGGKDASHQLECKTYKEIELE